MHPSTTVPRAELSSEGPHGRGRQHGQGFSFGSRLSSVSQEVDLEGEGGRGEGDHAVARTLT